MRMLPVIAGLLVGGAAMAQSPPPAPRVAWLSARQMESADSARQAVGAAVANGASVVVAPTGGADRPEDLAALQVAVKTGHGAGAKVFAAAPAFHLPAGSNWVPAVSPDWLALLRTGHAPPGGPLDPGHPDARKAVRDRILSVARQPGLDGVALTGLGYSGAETGFSDNDLAQFRTVVESSLTREQKDALAILPGRDVWTRMFPDRWARWRRDNVTGFLQGLHRALKAEMPAEEIVVTVSVGGPFATWEASDAYNARSQDVMYWKQQGILDAMLLVKDSGTPTEFGAWVSAARAGPGTVSVWAYQD